MLIVCPLRMDPKARDGCYSWREFAADFAEYWQRHFDAPPTLAHWQAARRDWRKASTGWEAVQIAISRARERVAKASQPAPIHIIGRHYALNEATAEKMRAKLKTLQDRKP